MQALVLDGEVVQIETSIFDVAPALQWVDITGPSPQPEVGWSYDGVIFTPPPLPALDDFKRSKRQEFKAETVTRMAIQVPAWNSFERIEFLISIANLLDIASITTAQALARDILLYTKNTAIPKINAMATHAEVAAVDPTLADPFGDGTVWPT